MPDIAMCDDPECVQRNQCYRFRAVPDSHRQSYFAATPRHIDDTCTEMLPIFVDDRLTPEH